ncbi:MAG: patatin-like phospholipase family protein [Gaiellaceae bacterium]
MSGRPRRALILAGGGIKVAFQAGALQVWLDEAGLEFDLADGASGGTFNLAMWAQGMTGTQIADNWRKLPADAGVDPNWHEYPKLLMGESLMRLDKFRDKVFPLWGLDWETIRASEREAIFNVYNFSRHELEILEPARMDADFLVACVSLPMWFPPVRRDGQIYIDSVFNTDANLEEAIRRGADELWVIWTVSERGDWNDGFVNQYFQTIEAAAVGRYKQALQRIADSNVALAAGENSEYGRHIEVKELRDEVPLQYLINFGSDRLHEVVNRGVDAARRWCAANGIAVDTSAAPSDAPGPSLRFTEEMKGFVAIGEADFDRGYRIGKEKDSRLAVRLTIEIEGVNRFVLDPNHLASVKGHVQSPVLGGRLAVEQGTFNLFTDQGDPRDKHMLYRLFFEDSNGRELTLAGHKAVHDDPGHDLYADTTILFTRVLAGRVEAAGDEEAEVIGAGIIRIHLLDFLHQLTTFRTAGGSAPERISALGRFGQLFLGSLWDVYASRVLSSGPI